MAFFSSTSKSASFLFLFALCFLFVLHLQSSDCNVGSGCFYVKATLHEVQHSRKLLDGMKGKKEMVFKSGMAVGSASGGGKGMKTAAGWELREAPMGPDPLHHHGGSPKKPKTP